MRIKTKFIVFEGIHGSGKTTSVWLLHKGLEKKGIHAKSFYEADMDAPCRNPCDFNFMAALDEAQHALLLDAFPDEKDRLIGSARKLAGYYVIYYPALNDNALLCEALAKHGVYNGRFDLDQFLRLKKGLFADFVETAINDDAIYVFESILFQHIINELLRFTNSTKTEMPEFISELAAVLKPLNPMLFYLKSDDIKSTVERVAAERLSDNYDLYPDWIDWMVRYVKESPYGKKYQVQNRSDLLEYFFKREEIEMIVFDALDMNKKIIYIDRIEKDTQNEMILDVVMGANNHGTSMPEAKQ